MVSLVRHTNVGLLLCYRLFYRYNTGLIYIGVKKT